LFRSGDVGKLNSKAVGRGKVSLQRRFLLTLTGSVIPKQTIHNLKLYIFPDPKMTKIECPKPKPNLQDPQKPLKNKPVAIPASRKSHPKTRPCLQQEV
jgi:hypothetical protein